MNEFENLISLLESPNKENFSLGLIVAQNYRKEIFEYFGCELEELENFITFLLESKKWNGEGSLFEIKKLYFEEENISVLPKTICILKRLKILNLSNNELQNIPVEIGNLTNLKRLHLQNNSLKISNKD